MYIGRPQKTGPYIKLDDISNQFDGIEVTFNLTLVGSPYYVDNPYTLVVSLNGVVQEPVTAFTTNHNQITFASAPATGSEFFCVVLGTTYTEPLRNATSLASGVDIVVGSISADNISSSGIVTASAFIGDGSSLTGIDATALKDSNGTVRVQANESGAVVTGILTATDFDGVDVTALRETKGGTIRVQANTSGAIVSGILTATSLDVSGNVSIAGTLTYEDVTNIDSVGLITARSGIHIGTGVTYTEDLVVDGDARITGILTIGTGTITIDGDNNSVNIGAGVTLHTVTSTFNQLEVTGVSTFVGVTTFVNSIYIGDTLHVPNVIISGNTLGDDVSTRNINASGIITATSGFNLGISSTGTSITNGGSVTTLNFVGAGNSITYNSGTKTVDISITSGSGSGVVIVDGGDFNSASSIAGAGTEINGGEFT